jgi:uroporphyrinogen-III synthase
MAQPRRTILITRPAEDSAGPAKRVETLGYRAVIAPMMRILRRTPAIPAQVQAILVTSGNALASLPPGPTRLLAVGDATATRARERGFARVESAGGDAVALAELVSQRIRPADGPLLLASGARQGEKLAADLRGRGFRVIRRVCYAAVPVGRFPAEALTSLQSGEVYAVLFLSAETASAFVRLLPPESHHAVASVAALAIGQPAAEVLQALPWGRISRARTPTLDDVLALI